MYGLPKQCPEPSAEKSWLRYATPSLPLMIATSNDALCHHSFSNLHEASDVGTANVVDVAVRLCAILHALLVNGMHDLVQLLVYFLCRPTEMHGILAHLQTACSYTAGVNSLAGSIKHFSLDKGVDSFGRATHIRDFTNAGNAISNELLCIIAIKFVEARSSSI